MKKHPKGSWRRGIAMAAILASVCALTPAANADDVSQDDIDKSQAAEASTSASIADMESQLAQLNANTQSAQIAAQAANEDYLQALADLDTAKKQAQDAQKKADTAAKNTQKAISDLGAVVSETYETSGEPVVSFLPYITSNNIADVTDQDTALVRAGESTNSQVQGIEALQAVSDTMQSIADNKLAQQQSAADAAQAAKTKLEAQAAQAQEQVNNAQAKREELLQQLAEQHKTTVALETKRQEQLEAARQAAAEEAARKAAEQEAARQEAARQAAAQEAARQAAASQASSSASSSSTSSSSTRSSGSSTSTTSSSSSSTASSTTSTTTSSYGGASTAIAAAKNYLGVPYVWAGESYSGLDCSGLVMVSWRQAGVYLPHSSRLQYGYGTKVPLSSMQPGDLIFWSSNGTQAGIYHVAMYLGNGQMIEAPTFGMTVRITSVRYSGTMPYAVRL